VHCVNFAGSLHADDCAGLLTAPQEVLALLDCSEQDRTELLSLLLKLHNSAAAQLAAAPRHFMAAADLYRATISSKREQLLQQQQFLKVCRGAVSGHLPGILCFHCDSNTGVYSSFASASAGKHLLSHKWLRVLRENIYCHYDGCLN
jgi:hypothetical protein